MYPNDKYPPHAIVRRIDDLGRIVVSREIRRALHIKEGDPLAMWTDNGRIIMQKYSELGPLEAEADQIAAVVARRTESVCLITNRDGVIAVAGSKPLERKLRHSSVGPVIRELYASGNPLHWYASPGEQCADFKLTDDVVPVTVEDIYMVPLMMAHEAIGAVIIFRPGVIQSTSHETAYGADAKACVTLAAELLLAKVEG